MSEYSRPKDAPDYEANTARVARYYVEERRRRDEQEAGKGGGIDPSFFKIVCDRGPSVSEKIKIQINPCKYVHEKYGTFLDALTRELQKYSRYQSAASLLSEAVSALALAKEHMVSDDKPMLEVKKYVERVYKNDEMRGAVTPALREQGIDFEKTLEEFKRDVKKIKELHTYPLMGV